MVNLARGIICMCLMVIAKQSECKEDRIIDSGKIVHRINSGYKSTWKAHTYNTKKLNINQFAKQYLGVKFNSKNNSARTKNDLKRKPMSKPETDKLPANFTWIDPKNTKCPIHHIRNQANCGSCWAVSTATAFGDRICIQSNATITVNISAQYITSCDPNNYGCEGGYMENVYHFLKSGVITGGDFDSDVGCQPYEIRPCSSNPLRMEMPCAYDDAVTPKCRKQMCTNDWYGSKKETKKNTFYAKSWKLIEGNALTPSEYYIRKDLYEYGPLTVAFWVYEDFLFYRSGIYSPTKGFDVIGGHAVRVVGWGEENGTKYWLIANSWGTDWGENGYFRMIRGINACECESMANSAMPDLKQ